MEGGGEGGEKKKKKKRSCLNQINFQPPPTPWSIWPISLLCYEGKPALVGDFFCNWLKLDFCEWMKDGCRKKGKKKKKNSPFQFHEKLNDFPKVIQKNNQVKN